MPDITGATGLTYTPQQADLGRRLRLRETATGPGGTVVQYSAWTDAVAAAPTTPATTPEVYLALDGVGDYVTTPDSANHTGSCSIEVDAELTNWNAGVFQELVSTGSGQAGTGGFRLRVTNANNVQFMVANVPAGFTTISAQTSAGTLAAGSRHTIKGVYDAATRTGTLFIDGQQVATNTSPNLTAPVASGAVWAVGAMPDPATPNWFANGRFYRAELFNGSGTTIWQMDADDINPSTTTWVSTVGGETWTRLGDAHKAYMGDKLVAATVSYDWTGANGTPWPTGTGQPFLGIWGGSTTDIQSNMGRALLPGTANAFAAAQVSPGNWDDFEVAVQVRWPSLTDNLLTVLDCRYTDPEMGYRFEARPASNVIALRVLGAAPTDLDTEPFTIAAGVTYNIRVRMIGQNLKAKMWGVGTIEPDWQLTAVSSAYSGGALQLTTRGPSTASSQHLLWDTLRVYNFTTTPVTPSTTADATIPVAQTVSTSTTATSATWINHTSITNQWEVEN